MSEVSCAKRKFEKNEVLSEIFSASGTNRCRHDATFSSPVKKCVEAAHTPGELGVGMRRQREYVSTNPRSGKVENVAEFHASKKHSGIAVIGT
jgi:hypothetical protein